MADEGLTPEQVAWFNGLSDAERARFLGHLEMSQVLTQFLEAITGDADLRAAWPLLHPHLRRQFVKPWLDGNRTRLISSGYDYSDTLIALSTERPEHPLWEQFMQVQAPYMAAPIPEKYGVGTNTRIVAPDIELLVIFDTTKMAKDKGGNAVTPPGEFAPGFPVLMRFDDGRWRVLTFGSDEVPDF